MKRRLRLILLIVSGLALTVPVSARPQLTKKLEGRWAITVTIPVAPNSTELRTLSLNLDVTPRGDSLHGRLVVTDDQSRVFGGVYRQSGKKVSITFELPCDSEGDATCATVVLSGKIKNKIRLKGSAVTLWDSGNLQNPALFDTSNGNFSGDRIQ
jgi:hypothetical protein